MNRSCESRSRRKVVREGLLWPFAWLGVGLGVAALAVLPHRALLTVCDLLSVLYFRFDRRGRRRALENLRILRGTCTGKEGTAAFDPETAPYDATRSEDLVIRRSYRNMTRTGGHIFWTLVRARRRVAAVGEMDGASRDFLRRCRPAVTVSGHLGCWEILSQLAYLEGHRMLSVAKRIGSGAMTRLLMRARRSIGQEIVPADGAFKLLLKGLQRGASLGLLVDQPVEPRLGGVFVRFLGRPVPVSVAPAFFAAKQSLSVIVAWSRPLKDGRYRCETIATHGPEEARDVWGLTQRCMRELETVIRRHPSCWVLNYNYFSNRPHEADLRQLARREGVEYVPQARREVVFDAAGLAPDEVSRRLQAFVAEGLDGGPLTVTCRNLPPAQAEALRKASGTFTGDLADFEFRIEGDSHG